MAIASSYLNLALVKAKSHRLPNFKCCGLTYLDDVMFCPKCLHKTRIIYLFSHCEHVTAPLYAKSLNGFSLLTHPGVAK